MSLKLDVLVSRVTTRIDRPAPASVAASDPEMVAAIAALSKKVDGLLERSTVAPDTTVAASAPEQTAAIAALSKKVDGLLERPITATALAPEAQHLAASAKKPASNPTPAKCDPAATPTKPAATKPAENVDSAWKPVVSRQTKRRQQIYPPTERRIVVQLAEASNNAQKAADTALRTVNRALVGHPDITVPPLFTA
jgi:hypothetical protein